MINDIFFSLIGVTGGVIIKDENCFKVNSDYNFIDNSQIHALEKVAEIGYNYFVLKNFVKNFNDIFEKQDLEELKIKVIENNNMNNTNNFNNNMNNNIKERETFNNNNNTNEHTNDDVNSDTRSINDINSKHLSIYFHPIKELLATYLEKYENELIILEQRYIQNNIISITDIYSDLNSFNNIFIRAIEFLQYIINNELKSSQLLDFVYQNICLSSFEVNYFFKELYINTNLFIFKILIEFIIEGNLDFTNLEFFIVPNNIKDNECLRSWNFDYYIDNNNIPDYYPSSIIDKSLFCSKAIKILNYNKNEENTFSIVNYNKILLDSIKTNLNSDLIIELVDFKSFEIGIDTVKDKVNKELWSFITVNYNLFHQIKLIKSVLLTFEGELYFNFINRIKHKLDCKWDHSSEEELNIKYFKQSIKDVYSLNSYYEDNKICFNDNNSNFIQLKEVVAYEDFEEYFDNFNEFNTSYSNEISSFSNNLKNSVVNNFSLKLITTGFEYIYNLHSQSNYKDIVYFGNIKQINNNNNNNYVDSKANNKLLVFVNSLYNKQDSGSLWNINNFDLENEFYLDLDFIVNNYSKRGVNSLNESSQQLFMQSSNKDNLLLMNTSNKKSGFKLRENNHNILLSNNNNLKHSRCSNYNKMDIDSSNNSFINNSTTNKYANFSLKKKNKLKELVINYVLHSSSNFDLTKSIVCLEDLKNYILIQIIIVYDIYKKCEKPFEILIIIKLINNNNLTKNREVNETEHLETIHKEQIDLSSFPEDMGFLANNICTNINISYKDNILYVNTNRFNLTSVVIKDLSYRLFKEKNSKKVVSGIILSSSNLDINVDIKKFASKFIQSDILYKENTNLILIDYNPSFPMNFIFHESIKKNYNQLFNVIFPLKTCLILLNNSWLDKKSFINGINLEDNILKNSNLFMKKNKTKHVFYYNYERFERKIFAYESEFILFLNNIIGFFMFDIIDPRYNKLIQNIKESKSFEKTIKLHEECLSEIVSLSFVKSKKIMSILFDIIYTIRQYYNLIIKDGINTMKSVRRRVKDIILDDNLKNINNSSINSNSDNSIAQNEEDIKINKNILNIESIVDNIKNDFKVKKANFISTFLKIKNSKFFKSVSTLLTKIDDNYNKYNDDNNEFLW